MCVVYIYMYVYPYIHLMSSSSLRDPDYYKHIRGGLVCHWTLISQHFQAPYTQGQRDSGGQRKPLSKAGTSSEKSGP